MWSVFAMACLLSIFEGLFHDPNTLWLYVMWGYGLWALIPWVTIAAPFCPHLCAETRYTPDPQTRHPWPLLQMLPPLLIPNTTQPTGFLLLPASGALGSLTCLTPRMSVAPAGISLPAKCPSLMSPPHECHIAAPQHHNTRPPIRTAGKTPELSLWPVGSLEFCLHSAKLREDVANHLWNMTPDNDG